MKQLLNQVNVRQQHPSAAVPSQAQFIQGVAFGAVLLEEGQVGVPLVADYLAASEATNGDDHCGELELGGLGRVKKGLGKGD